MAMHTSKLSEIVLMMSNNNEILSPVLPGQKRLPSPYLIFLLVHFIFYYIAVLYLAFGGTDLNFCYTNNYLTIASIFLFAYLLPGLLFFRKKLLIRLPTILAADDKIYAKLYKFAIFFVLCSAAYVIYYAFFSGRNKLFLLGSDLDANTFRFLGYDDDSRIFQIPLELARRVLLPLSLIYAAVAYYYGRARRDKILFVLVLPTLLLASVLTLDRGPVLLALVTLMFCLYIYTPTNSRFFTVYLPVLIVLLPLVGAVVTMLQHNLTEFDFGVIKEQSYAVALNRIWLDPLNMSCRDCFNAFDGWNGCLLLRYSRLTSFITGEYVGTYNDNSMYITPVGIVGDVWRNFGYIGIAILPILLASILLRVGTLMQKKHPVVNYIVAFLTLVFSFYVNYGNIFTYGAMILLFFIVALVSRKLWAPLLQ
ncbi:MAG: O-antigen ligase [Elusimicrobiales bacterium]|nr:O-antigen ligase [Elusimicrobiales bacterium]